MIKMTRTDGSACFELTSLADTCEFGKAAASAVRPGLTLLLHGGLGAGKTTFVREMCRALGWRRTCSPSFALVNEYAAARIPVAHADLYRVDGADGRDFGFDDYLDDGWLLIVEWPERLVRSDFVDVWRCDISGTETRRFCISAEGEMARAALERLCASEVFS